MDKSHNEVQSAAPKNDQPNNILLSNCTCDAVVTKLRSLNVTELLISLINDVQLYT